MLENIRNNSQSLWVKVAFGVIILVFIFWGIGNYSTPSTIVAKVDDYEITEQEFLTAYNQQYQRLASYIPNLTEEQLKEMNFSYVVLESLISKALLTNEAKRTGIDISPRELFDLIAQFPLAQDANGNFSAENYLAALEQAGQSPRAFEDTLKADMREGKYRQLLGNFAYVSEEQGRLLFNYQFEERQFDAYFIANSEYLNSVVPTEEELQRVYETRQAEFTLPASMALEYIEISPEKLAKPESITQAEIQAEYDKNPALYDIPETVTASHILIMLAETATAQDEEKALNTIQEIQTKLSNGEEFAQLAKEYSQDPGSAFNGGDLGSFTRGQMVMEFENAAFATAVGEISEPVRSQFGYHLIKVSGKEEAKAPAKDELNATISEKLALQKANSEVQSLLDSLLIQIHGGEKVTSLVDVAKNANLNVEYSTLLPVTEIAEKYYINNTDMQTLIGLENNSFAPSPITTANGVMVVKVMENLPDRVMPFEDVKPVVTELAKKELAQEEALKQAELLLEDTAKIQQAKIKNYVIGRDGIFELGDSVELANALFSAKIDNTWIDTAFAMNDGYVIAKPTAIIQASDELWNDTKETRMAELTTARQNMFFSIYMQNLRNNASVEILNPLYFE